MKNAYGFGKEVSTSFEETVPRVVEALQREGFGILSDIDVAATLKKRLGKEMPPYRILGACHPQLAHQVLEIEPTVGLLMPCNAVVRQDAAGKVHVEVMDPEVMSTMLPQEAVKPLAAEAKARLQRVLDSL
ncbi:conserved protein of unknown function [Methylacidimicrobium sp. AP8]|uniref:DUF302 domain-containing protein n=1 Tax=Methylacidimicrobium sp. AP8 TaxID=2730359 RepID=UPI0018C17121|nr:DUF302 domain-containing protein [Methylacidimicrobium sp. AP8]CAB4243968.1 conserved protein of unknown function [Methylacidimicrobium sp. AP8]